jgi:hypothetical protein
MRGGAEELNPYLAAPALRGPMDANGIGQMYSNLTPDLETLDLMTKGEEAYTGAGRKSSGRVTPAEKEALQIHKKAMEMGMSLDAHLKHNKVPAAKRRTYIKRVENAMRKMK